mgnify:CR=1 FL=1
MRHDFAFIKSNKKLIKLRFDEVVFIKGLGNYVEIAMSGGEKYVYYRSLKELINSLPEIDANGEPDSFDRVEYWRGTFVRYGCSWPSERTEIGARQDDLSRFGRRAYLEQRIC